MRNLFPGLLLASALLLALAPLAKAQTPAPAAAYTGPRFPGGPDSLRALIGRSTRLATPAPAGRMMVQFELKPDGQPYNFSMVRPPDPLQKPLVEATATALNYLEAHMPAWQPALPDPDADPANQVPKLGLALSFESSPTSRPYEYADQNPVFATMGTVLQSRHSRYFDRILADPAQLAQFQSSPRGLVTMIQLLVMYPPEALRGRQQGTVYAYFEVAESGAIEHPQILGTAGRALDAEVLRAMSKLPAATTPAQLQGRPARVSYIVPVNFRIQ